MIQAGYDMLYLIACALNSQKPDLKNIKETDREKLYYLAKRHSLMAIVIMVLEDAGEQIRKEWIEEKDKAVRKSILMDVEYQQIANYMERNGIWYVPLKGRILQEYYPKMGMRQMADTDILFDSKYRRQVGNFFINRGYKEESYGQGNHDVYLKLPVYNYEMHVKLFDEIHGEIFNRYYINVREKLIKKADAQYEYVFSKEDFYIYFITHSYKHFVGSGTGIRTVVDCYLYLKAEEKNMDWDYIRREIEKIGLGKFEEEIRILSKKIFDISRIEVLSDEEKAQLEYYFSSGTYGTLKNRVHNEVDKISGVGSFRNAKYMYLIERIFPSKNVLEAYSPVIAKYKVLLPFAWAKRIVKGVMLNHKRIRSEIKYLNEIEDK